MKTSSAMKDRDMTLEIPTRDVWSEPGGQENLP